MQKTQPKIAIIEDDVMLAEIYQTRIKLLGYDCVVSNEGASGLELIKNEKPDLVLLDLMLPLKSGMEILEEMRNSEWGKNTKVLILTNISEAEAPVNIRDYKIEGYVIKANLSHDQFDQVITKIIDPAPTNLPKLS